MYINYKKIAESKSRVKGSETVKYFETLTQCSTYMIKKKKKSVLGSNGPWIMQLMMQTTPAVPALYIVKSYVIRLVHDRGKRLLILVRFSKNKNKSKNKTKQKIIIQNICCPSSTRVLCKFPVSVTLCLKSKKINKMKSKE